MIPIIYSEAKNHIQIAKILEFKTKNSNYIISSDFLYYLNKLAVFK